MKYADSNFSSTSRNISNKHFCKLGKIVRNFCSWQNFVFVTVCELFGFEVCHFKQWSCDILERYRTPTPTTAFSTCNMLALVSSS